ncbi:hypothetical protein TNCV_1569251, partial [Trichonephila clavipes]
CLGLGNVTFQVLPQLVQIQGKDPPEKVYCGADCSFLITKNMSLLVCGSNRHNKIGMDSSEGSLIDEIRVFTPLQLEALHITKVVSVSSGKSHTVIMDDFGELYSMGSNRFGQLGWGKPGLDYNSPQKIEKLKGVKVLQIACGDCFTLVITHGMWSNLLHMGYPTKSPSPLTELVCQLLQVLRTKLLAKERSKLDSALTINFVFYECLCNNHKNIVLKIITYYR